MGRPAKAGLAVIAIALVPFSGGCGSDDSGDTADSATVAMNDDLSFDPQRIEVAPGTTITWHNEGEVPHDVVASSRASFRSPLVRAGEHYETTAPASGTVDYRCTLHPGMEGTIVVSAG